MIFGYQNFKEVCVESEKNDFFSQEDFIRMLSNNFSKFKEFFDK